MKEFYKVELFLICSQYHEKGIITHLLMLFTDLTFMPEFLVFKYCIFVLL